MLVLIEHMQVISSPHPSILLLTGQYGVTIFLVLSGFLITSRLCSESESTGRIHLGRFYLRRFFRLMPCAWYYLFFISILSLSARQLAGFGLVPSLFFFRNYSNTPLTNALTGHFWSLSLEEQFYMTWPLLLVWLGARRSQWLAAAVSVLIAGYRFAAWGRYDQVPMCFRTEVRADALLVGCLAALLLNDDSLRGYFTKVVKVGFLPAACVFLFCVFQLQPLPTLYECLAVVVLIGYTTSNPSGLLARFLELRWIMVVGRTSYSIYIWQQIFACAINHHIKMMPWLLFLPVVVFLSYRFVEIPGIAAGRKLEAYLFKEPVPVPV